MEIYAVATIGWDAAPPIPVPLPVVLYYATNDSAAIRIDIPALRHEWFIGRKKLAEALTTIPTPDNHVPAAQVHIHPIGEETVIFLHREDECHPIVVSTLILLEHLAVTYLLCPERAEQEAINDELAKVLGNLESS